jgi:hypothetical protein
MQQSRFFLALIIALLLITVGDRFLPKPLSTWSRNTRIAFERAMKSIIPDWNLDNPHRRSEEAIEKQEQGEP